MDPLRLSNVRMKGRKIKREEEEGTVSTCGTGHHHPPPLSGCCFLMALLVDPLSQRLPKVIKLKHTKSVNFPIHSAHIPMMMVPPFAAKRNGWQVQR